MVYTVVSYNIPSSCLFSLNGFEFFVAPIVKITYFFCSVKCHSSVCDTHAVMPMHRTFQWFKYSYCVSWCVCLLCCTFYIQFRLVRFHLLLDYIKLALFLFLFLTDFCSWLVMNVRLLRWLLSRGLIFMSPPTCHFHHCAVIFSHSMLKVLYRTSRPFSNSFFYDDLSKRRTVLFVGGVKIIKATSVSR